jgi:DNA polymerase
MDGRALMLKMTKPRKATKNNAAKWHETPEDVARLVQYCVRDIEAETQVFLSTPPLSPNERKIWELDQKINLRGVHVDRDLVKKSLAMVDVELASLNGELSRITGGEIDSAGQTARIKEFTGLPDTTAKTIRDALKLEGWGDTVRRVMEIRRDASKTSTAKYLAFEQRTRSDSVLRDILLYNGAMPTARWTGRGVQVQNFPRGQQGLNTNLSCEMVKEHDLETIRLLYGNPMDVFSSNLRGCLVPPEGEAFFCGDYASIEVRVLFWLAGNEEGLKALREGRDLYREMAVKIYNVELDKVTDAQREIGKRAVLGCGYQMGWETFQETCENFDTPVTDEVAKRAVNAFRETHHQVKQLWYNYEQAAIRAVAHPGRRFTVNRTTWFVVGKFLWCELPSGRRMAYPYPELRQVKTPWGELRAKLYHYDINPMAGGWVLAGTYGGKLAENVTQGGARDVMADSMVRLEETHKYTARLSVHDELLTTAPWTWDLKTFENLMAETPAWAEGLPVKVKAWKGPRYGKH